MKRSIPVPFARYKPVLTAMQAGPLLLLHRIYFRNKPFNSRRCKSCYVIMHLLTMWVVRSHLQLISRLEWSESFARYDSGRGNRQVLPRRGEGARDFPMITASEWLEIDLRTESRECEETKNFMLLMSLNGRNSLSEIHSILVTGQIIAWHNCGFYCSNVLYFFNRVEHGHRISHYLLIVTRQQFIHAELPIHKWQVIFVLFPVSPLSNCKFQPTL